jgi:ArsR family transcriptional regulator
MSISIYHELTLVKLFKSLADEMRLRILRLLIKGSFHVNEIQYIVNGKQSNISHHLKILQESQIVVNKKEGSLIYYRFNDIDKNPILNQIYEIINLNSTIIPNYDEDIKRLEAIVTKRKKNAEDFFNSIGTNYDYLQEELFKNIYSVKEALTFFDKNKMESLIDIGCGTGKNFPLLAKYSNKVIGIDSSPSMIQLSEHICKNNNLNYELKLGDITKMPFESQSIDGAFINMVLHHLSNPAEVLAETARILKKSGKLLLIELLSHEDESMREKYADLWLGFTMEELSSWLITNGFKIDRQIIKSGLNNLNKHNVIIILAEKNSM